MYLNITPKETKFNKDMFKSLCKTTDIQSGRYNDLDYYINELTKNEGEQNIAVSLFSLFIECSHTELTNNVFLGILYCIKNFEEEKNQQLVSMITSRGISHNDPCIIEMSIRCYEHWNSKFSLSHLKTVDNPKIEWLNSYKQCVLRDLEANLINDNKA